MSGTKAFVYIGTLLIVCLLLMGGSPYPTVYFQMADPVADEYGYGTYQYPGNIAFKPYKGLFDLTGFKVWSEKPGEIYFDTGFEVVTNPWAAPEGFIHQNLRIFIDSQPDQGFTNLPQPGAEVRFNPAYGWDLCLKIVGWENSQLLVADGLKLKTWPLKTELLRDGRTIRAKVPESQIGCPQKSWNYYVMVGSYDGFGADFFRKVKAKKGEWVFGGGLDQEIEPQVMDILAPAKGPHSQTKQLSSFNRETGELAELTPVGLELGAKNHFFWIVAAGALIVLGAAVGLFRYQTNKISWFWVPKSRKPAATKICKI